MTKRMRLAQVKMTLSFNASPEKVWKALTTDINKWWSEDLYTIEKSRRFILDATLGGKMYEDAGDGTGVVWGEVIAVDPGSQLILRGNLAPSFGGPATSYLTITLQPAGEKCQFVFSDEVFGYLSDGMEGNLEEGWDLIFNTKLRKYLEG